VTGNDLIAPDPLRSLTPPSLWAFCHYFHMTIVTKMSSFFFLSFATQITFKFTKQSALLQTFWKINPLCLHSRLLLYLLTHL